MLYRSWHSRRYHSTPNTSKFIQQCKVVPYFYAVYWLRRASSAFSFARKCIWLAGIMVIRWHCVMRRAWRHKLQWSEPTLYSLYCDDTINTISPFHCFEQCRYTFGMNAFQSPKSVFCNYICSLHRTWTWKETDNWNTPTSCRSSHEGTGFTVLQVSGSSKDTE